MKSRVILSTILLFCAGQALGGREFVQMPLMDDRSDTWQRLHPPFNQVPQSSCLKLDSQGNPLICYDPMGSSSVVDGLYFAWFDGASWDEVLVDSLEYSSTGCCMALSPEGLPRILYHDYYWENLKYAWYDGNSWHTEIVQYDRGSRIDMALDSQGNPHISFIDNSTNGVFYGVRDVSGWSAESIGTLGTWPTSIAVDQYDRPHIVWDAGLPITHAWLEGIEWQTEVIDTYQYAYGFCLNYDPDWNLHLAAQMASDLIYYRKEGAVWIEELVDDMSGNECSMIIGNDGLVHIAYDDGLNSDLRYARRDAIGWETYVLSWEGFNALSPSIDLDVSGNPYIFHSQFSDSELLWWGSGPLGIGEEEIGISAEDAFVSVSPNPASFNAEILLCIVTEGEYSLLVYDIAGRRTGPDFAGYLAEGEHILPMDLTGLPQGTYLLVLTGNSMSWREKLVLVR